MLLVKRHHRMLWTLDADMIPMKNFLMESLPFFIENEMKRQKLREQGVKEKELPKPLGFIQLPQVFYNADIFQYYFILRGSNSK